MSKFPRYIATARAAVNAASGALACGEPADDAARMRFMHPLFDALREFCRENGTDPDVLWREVADYEAACIALEEKGGAA